ncbi:MAG: hypothetical protein KUG59_03175 [Parvibaculaceae bacterium]|nr:hypothetical protein [Parvibaculaceae bacterium]
MLTRLNFLTVYLSIFGFMLTCMVVVLPLTEQALAPEKTRFASIDLFEEVGK